MAAISPELQKELLRSELETEQRAASKAAIQAKEGKERELNNQENAALIAYVNKLLLGRDAWLKQMREIQERAKRRALTVVEENALNDQVGRLLRAHPNFFAEFKYESNKEPDVDPSNATGFDAKLKGMFSKMSNAFGDGPFGFIGKLFEKILSFIFPMIAVFKEMGEVLNPKPTVADLIKEGSFDLADAELENQERALIDKLKPLRDKNGEEIVEIKRLLDAYEAQLLKLQEVDLENGIKVSFSETSDQYKRHTLSLRARLFNDISAKAAPILQAHAEAIDTEQQRQLKEQQHTRLRETMAGVQHSPEADILKARMEAVAADMKNLAEKRTSVQGQETAAIAEAVRGGMKRDIINMYANATHTEKLAREKAQLAALAQQRVQQQVEAQRHEERQRRARPARQGAKVDAEEVD